MNNPIERRGFLAAIGGVVTGVPQVHAMELKPGQVFVLECDVDLSIQAVEHIRVSWKQAFAPSAAPKLLILSHGMKLKVAEGTSEVE